MISCRFNVARISIFKIFPYLLSIDAIVLIEPEASALEITKEKASGPAADVKVGDPVTYTITIKNAGAAELTDVLVTESMIGVWSNPSAALYTALGSAVPTGDHFTIPSLPVGAEWTIDYTVEATETGTLENLVTARDGNGEGDNHDEDDDATVIVTAMEIYTVTYHGNTNTGGTAPADTKGNAPSGSNKYYEGSTVKILGSGTLTKDGYTFTGWNTKADGTGDKYAAGAVHANITANLNLYARWKKDNIPPEDPPKPPVPPDDPGIPPADPPVPPRPPVITPPVVDPPVPPAVITQTPPEEAIPEPVEPEAAAPDPATSTRETVGFSPAKIFRNLLSGNVPAGDFYGKDAWSLLSLIMSVIGVLITVILIISAIVRKRREDEEDKHEDEYLTDEEREERDKKRRRGNVSRALTCIAGVLVLIVWLILDDLTLPMAWINRWTLFVGIVFIVHIVLLVIYKGRRAKSDEENEEDNSQSIAG